MRCAVVVPTYNRKEGLLATLSSLRDLKGSARVIVCDDGSDDGTQAAVQKLSDITYLRQEHRQYGLSRARNMGIQAVGDADCVAFLDSGVTVFPDWLEAHTRTIAGGADVSVGYLYGNRLSLSDATSPFSIEDPQWSDLRHQSFFQDFERLRRLTVPWVQAWMANVAVSGKVCRTVGGFEESFVSWGFEDQEWAFRAWRAGYRIAPNRAAAAIHWPHSPTPHEPLSGKLNAKRSLDWLRDWRIEIIALEFDGYSRVVEKVLPVLEMAKQNPDGLDRVIRGHGRWAAVGPGAYAATKESEPQPALCLDPCATSVAGVEAMLGMCVPFVRDGEFDEVIVLPTVSMLPNDVAQYIRKEAQRIAHNVITIER